MTVEVNEELAEEAAYLTACRAAFDQLVADARHRVVRDEHAAGDAYTAEVLGRMLKSRAKELSEETNGPIFFGRLDFATGPHAGERYYVGRRHIGHPDGPERGNPLVVDWRAPVSRAFYQASKDETYGVELRRRYGWRWDGRTDAELTGFENERLEDDDTPSALLRQEIERPRVGPMRDIVATIQPDQDVLVRADLDHSVCVQGAPGTGKTAVGLHRAAYLLYAHRQRLKRHGVLVIGPNQAFLGYISAVLPALGEVDVEQTTVDELVAGQPVRAADTAEAAIVKHDARMAAVLANALEARIGTPTETLTVPDGQYRWRIPAYELAELVAEVRAERTPYTVGRERLRSRIVARLQRAYESRGGTPGSPWLRRIGRAKPVVELLERIWPKVKPAELVKALLGDETALATAAHGILTREEQAAIRKPGGAWTAADLLLIDEVDGLVQSRTSYGHVIVDEAQDLSPMQCRAIARRSQHGSLSVLGDLAQGGRPWSARDWPTQLGHLGAPDASVVELTVGYRVPAAVVELANRILAALPVDVPPGTSYRADGDLRLTRVPDVTRGVVEAVERALTYEGSVGVITSPQSVGPLARAFEEDRVTVLAAGEAKGMEYDHVVVAEPADIVESDPRGLHLLYVAVTRAVSRLDLVHARDLPRVIS